MSWEAKEKKRILHVRTFFFAEKRERREGLNKNSKAMGRLHVEERGSERPDKGRGIRKGEGVEKKKEEDWRRLGWGKNPGKRAPSLFLPGEGKNCGEGTTEEKPKHEGKEGGKGVVGSHKTVLLP